jgi:hypothetical protein
MTFRGFAYVLRCIIGIEAPGPRDWGHADRVANAIQITYNESRTRGDAPWQVGNRAKSEKM